LAQPIDAICESAKLEKIKTDVAELTARFPLYPRRVEAGGK